jgi:hypothetical protein
MWILLIRSAVTGVFGSAFGKWFLSTRMGRWFQTKLDTFMEYLANKYNIKVAKKEIAWSQAYPNLANRIELLENWSHRPLTRDGSIDLKTEIGMLKKEIINIKSTPTVIESTIDPNDEIIKLHSTIEELKTSHSVGLNDEIVKLHATIEELKQDTNFKEDLIRLQKEHEELKVIISNMKQSIPNERVRTRNNQN